jgi:hypothetical protein
VEHVCEATHDKIPSSTFLFLKSRARNESSLYRHDAGERLGRRRQLSGCNCQSRPKKDGLPALKDIRKARQVLLDPLAVDQRNGISVDRVTEICATMMHGRDH